MRSIAAPDQPYDVAIIGAGVVGCAVFRELTLAGLNAILLEAGSDILSGASKANSALLHTGFDATPGTLEARLVADGHARYGALHQPLNLPLIESGAIVVAWNDSDHAALPGILDKARANGVTDCRMLTPEEIHAREPYLAAGLMGGVLVPREAIIDPWSAPLAYVRQALAHGGAIRFGFAVSGGARQDGLWTLRNKQGDDIRARVVINCAGNQGDIVEAIARPSPFEIHPRKGQFLVLDKTAHRLASAIILPVPNERTKGVVIARTAFGNLLVGPTAEEQQERDIATVETGALESLLAQGSRMIPALAAEPVTTAYAGLRPATQFKDYQIEALPTDGWISVAGIRSTGLTGALGIGGHVAGLYETHFGPLRPIAAPLWTPVPNLAEDRLRPWQSAGRSEILCHCELVTRGEIEAALEGPLPAGNLGGLKRRTRCMMGRCQGFYCSRRVLEVAAPHLPGLVEPIS